MDYEVNVYECIIFCIAVISPKWIFLNIDIYYILMYILPRDKNHDCFERLLTLKKYIE
jgi:hypothetical protein